MSRLTNQHGGQKLEKRKVKQTEGGREGGREGGVVQTGASSMVETGEVESTAATR